MIEQFFKFCVVGGSGVFVDFGVTYLCKEWLKLNKYVANSLGVLCASTSNYILNRIWTFQNENPDITGQYLRFLGIAAVGLVINNATIYVLHGRFRLNFYLAKLFAIGVVTFWNFFMNYFFTFFPAPYHLRLRIRRKGSFSTPKNASPKIPPDIFDVPSRRSTKMIDTSLSRIPSRQAEYFISIWNP